MCENETEVIDGKVAFELYDTFGFPFDLTRLMITEAGREVDEKGFRGGIAETKREISCRY